MKVLVTGANGLLGANLIREFVKSNVEVKAFVRPSADLKVLRNVICEITHGNILSYENLYQALLDCDAVVHAAATTSVVPRAFKFYKEINFESTKNIIEAALRQGNKRLIYVSTANVFGPGSKEQPATELSQFTLGRFKSGYIDSKYMSQQLVLESVERRNLNAVIVNPTFIIGPYDAKPSSGKIILHGLKKGIQWCPPGGKNFVHTYDVAKGICRALQAGRNGECYLLAGENLTYREFLSLLNQVVNRPRVQITIPKGLLLAAGMTAELWSQATHRPFALTRSNAHLICLDNYYSGQKAKEALGLKTTPIKDAIQEALSWFKKENYVSAANYSIHGTNFDL